MNILKGIGAVLREVLASKAPTVMRSGYCRGERVTYIDPDVVPVHQGTVVRTWNDKVKVNFDGFELGTWLEEEAITRVGI